MPGDKSLTSLKERVNAAIEARRGEAIWLCSEFIRRPTDNPPSDTRELVSFIADLLRKRDIPYQVHEIKEHNQNLVARLEGRRGGGRPRNLVLNGHLDQFPAGDLSRWTFDPYCGEVRDGKILGRGAGDMKGGAAALTFAFMLMRELSIPLEGDLTLMLVADEESGGKYGTKWLLDNREEVRGTAMLSGEDTGAHLIRVGEKGNYWTKITITADSGHGGLGRRDTPVTRMAEIVRALYSELAGMPGTTPEELRDIIAFSRRMLDDEFGQGTGTIVDHTSVNVGTIRGGVKTNIIPGDCEITVDVRLPLGVRTQDVAERLRALVERHSPGAKIEVLSAAEPNYTGPSAEILQLVKNNVAVVTQKEPCFWLTYTSTDARFFRPLGIPVGQVGPAVYNMGGPNEYIYADEYVDVVKIHADTIIDYVGRTA
jgi:succinyl-diaminopimelate desuccinylase